jgi:hypothetical protein
VGRHRDDVVEDLELVDRRDHGCLVVDDPQRAGQRELEVAVASALAEPRAGRIHGDAAGHDEIDPPDLRG